jgi:hypothetical protein
MGTTAQRQEARRRAREARSSQEQERKAREKRLEDLAVTVLVEVDVAAERERRAGEALRAMTDDEGVSMGEAVSWCGDGITLREATRLKRVVGDTDIGQADGGDAGKGSGVDDTGSGSGTRPTTSGETTGPTQASR